MTHNNHVVILGPSETRNYFGGVAIFCEGVARASSEITGRSLLLNTEEHQQYVDGEMTERSDHGWLRFFSKLISAVRRQPELIVLQLQYGLLAPLIRLLAPSHCRIFFYAHGFPPASYSWIRRNGILLAYRVGRAFSGQFLANSSYTASILEAVWGFKVDKTVNPSVSEAFLKELTNADHSAKTKAPQHFLYIGRITREKGLEDIIQCLSLLSLEGACLDVIGDGPELAHVEAFARNAKVKVNFLGRMTQQGVANALTTYRSFVSANRHEPYGITYAEAALSGCHVYCPPSGGQIDIARLMPGHFTFIDFQQGTTAAQELESSLRLRLNSPAPAPSPDPGIAEKFHYRECARQLLS